MTGIENDAAFKVMQPRDQGKGEGKDLLGISETRSLLALSFSLRDNALQMRIELAQLAMIYPNMYDEDR